ncbi:hypothetical protein BDV18DRAFT_139866 [Aspergillus unguis]
MANTTAPPQIPQHVSALLSHLTSRPGVQSTLILSRKDGSIIQTTGLLAPPTTPKNRSENASPAPTALLPEDTVTVTETETEKDTTTDTAGTSTETEAQTQTQQVQSPSATMSTQAQPQPPAQAQSKPYQPSQAEALAAHIFAFVSSASNLSFSLSHPVDETSAKSQSNGGIHDSGLTNGNGGVNGSISPGAGRDEAENENPDSQDDDEVKLLRLRTKKHEIVVVPDRKYLLCVVQDAMAGAGAATAGTGSGAGLATGGRFSR